jgi:hypothetical protein
MLQGLFCFNSPPLIYPVFAPCLIFYLFLHFNLYILTLLQQLFLMKRLVSLLLATLVLAACKDDELEPEPTPESLIIGKWRIETMEDIAVTMIGDEISRRTDKYGRGFYTFQSDGKTVISGEGTCHCPISGGGTYRLEELNGKNILIRGEDWYADTVQVTTLNPEKLVLEKGRILGRHYHENFPGIQLWVDRDIHKHITTLTRAQ